MSKKITIIELDNEKTFDISMKDFSRVYLRNVNEPLALKIFYSGMQIKINNEIMQEYVMTIHPNEIININYSMDGQYLKISNQPDSNKLIIYSSNSIKEIEKNF